MLEIDPVGLVRNRKGTAAEGSPLASYVNDRPYVASSFMSVALAKLFGTAMAGRSKDRPDLVDQALPLEVSIPVLPCRGGEPILRRLFEALGYEVHATPIALDERFTARGTSRLSRPLCGRERGLPMCWLTSTSCFPSWTTTSTTGSPRTRWRS